MELYDHEKRFDRFSSYKLKTDMCALTFRSRSLVDVRPGYTTSIQVRSSVKQEILLLSFLKFFLYPTKDVESYQLRKLQKFYRI